MATKKKLGILLKMYDVPLSFSLKSKMIFNKTFYTLNIYIVVTHIQTHTHTRVHIYSKILQNLQYVFLPFSNKMLK